MNPNPLKAKYATKVISGTIITAKKVIIQVANAGRILYLNFLIILALLIVYG